MRISICITAATLALAGCASTPAPLDRADADRNVSLVNSLSWTNAVSGKPDALRTAWPLDKLGRHTEQFPLAQVKQCDAEGVCRWGVMKAQRTLSAPRLVPGGVVVDVELTVDVNRSHAALQGGERVAIVIPADVPALSLQRTVRKAVTLQYGKVERFEFDFGIGYDLCVKRLDAAGKAVDACAIAYM